MAGVAGRFSSAAPYLLAVAVFVFVADVAVLPTVSVTHRSTAVAVPKVSSDDDSGIVLTPPPTSPTELTVPTPTTTPPADLGSLLLDLSSQGYAQFTSTFTGPFDADGAVAEISDATARPAAEAVLQRYGFTRGFRTFWRAGADGSVVELKVEEWSTDEGAQKAESLAVVSFVRDTKFSLLSLPPSLSDAVGATFDSTASSGRTLHNASIVLAVNAHLYGVYESSANALDTDALIAIAEQQAAAG